MFGDVMTETLDLIFVNEDKLGEEKPTAVGRIEDVTNCWTTVSGLNSSHMKHYLLFYKQDQCLNNAGKLFFSFLGK